MDYVDRSNDVAEVYLTESRAWRKPEVSAPGGLCLNCGEVLEPALRWCDADCRDDWERLTPQQRVVTPEQRRRSFGFSGVQTIVDESNEPNAAEVFREQSALADLFDDVSAADE